MVLKPSIRITDAQFSWTEEAEEAQEAPVEGGEVQAQTEAQTLGGYSAVDNPGNAGNASGVGNPSAGGEEEKSGNDKSGHDKTHEQVEVCIAEVELQLTGTGTGTHTDADRAYRADRARGGVNAHTGTHTDRAVDAGAGRGAGVNTQPPQPPQPTQPPQPQKTQKTQSASAYGSSAYGFVLKVPYFETHSCNELVAVVGTVGMHIRSKSH
jgi:hypothetical protein